MTLISKILAGVFVVALVTWVVIFETAASSPDVVNSKRIVSGHRHIMRR
jgi:hypothetical protein